MTHLLIELFNYGPAWTVVIVVGVFAVIVWGLLHEDEDEEVE